MYLKSQSYFDFRDPVNDPDDFMKIRRRRLLPDTKKVLAGGPENVTCNSKHRAGPSAAACSLHISAMGE